MYIISCYILYFMKKKNRSFENNSSSWKKSLFIFELIYRKKLLWKDPTKIIDCRHILSKDLNGIYFFENFILALEAGSVSNISLKYSYSVNRFDKYCSHDGRITLHLWPFLLLHSRTWFTNIFSLYCWHYNVPCSEVT